MVFFSWQYAVKQRPVSIEGRTAVEWAGFLIEPQASPSLRKKQAVKVLQEHRAEAERQLARNLVEKETLRAKAYARVWKSLPPGLKNRLPLPPYVPLVGTRQLAATAIGHLGPPLSLTLEDALIEACRDPDVIVRERAAIILSWYGHNRPAIIQAVNEAVRDRFVAEAVKAGPGFFRFDFEPANFAQALVAQECLSTDVRYKGLLKMEQIEGSKTQALPLLLRNLGDTNDLIVNASLRVLGTMGRTASNAVPSIKALERHESAGVRTKAHEALVRLTAEQN